MADDRITNADRTNADRDRVQNRNLTEPVMRDEARDASGVNVYDRPASTRPATNNMWGWIIAIVVILILAYFVFQWLV